MTRFVTAGVILWALWVVDMFATGGGITANVLDLALRPFLHG